MHFPEIFCLNGHLWFYMNAEKKFSSMFGIPSHRVLILRGMLTHCFLFQLQTGRQETTGAALGCWLRSYSVIYKHIKAQGGVDLYEGWWYSSEPPEPELYTEKLERRASKHFKLRGCYLKYHLKITHTISKHFKRHVKSAKIKLLFFLP